MEAFYHQNVCLPLHGYILLQVLTIDYHTSQTSTKDGSNITVSFSNVTIICSQSSDASFSAAQAVAMDSSSFLSAIKALASIGLTSRILVEGTVTVSNETGWKEWPELGIYMGINAALQVVSQSGQGLIDFRMAADRIILPGGILYLDNMKFVNLCTTEISNGGFTYFFSLCTFGFTHNW